MRRYHLTLLAIAWLSFGVSWFLPAFRTSSEWSFEHDGWEAASLALWVGFDGEPRDLLRRMVLIAQVATNVVMLTSPIVLFARFPRVRNLYPHLLLACSLVDIPWWAINAKIAWFGVGYFAWLGSFVLATVAMHLGRWKRRPEKQKWETGLISSI